MASPKDHIEEIRKKRFWIGCEEKNPLSKTVHQAVRLLSAELYSKDVHFLMELIQNAEDNEYHEGVKPSLEFIITSQDITATGAPSTLLIFNNEKGFSRKNMESISNVGDSTKAGHRKRGYIGEKGIGFKSVFLLTSHPYIFSNGYQIRFGETPCPECGIAYIVPEWVDSKPSMSEIQKIYGQSRTLPTTTIILPLKSDKVKAVKEQLSNLHPELLLFLSKIKQLSVREDNIDPRLNTVRAISISSERDVVSKKNIDAESYTVDLSAKEEGNHEEDKCWYYMWKQRFPVKIENKVEKRMDMEEITITLAFPYGERLNRGMSSAGIYSFLPTETVTNLPFVIQADFLLPSSRESILWDDRWNQGILDCVPTAFIHAFVSLVRTKEDAPPSSLASMFKFLPVDPSSHPKLNMIRESIKEKLLQENIFPSETPLKQKFFHKPGEIWRLMPGFWNILLEAKKREKLHNLSSEGKHILNSSFDVAEYDKVLNFLGIKFVDYEWYPKCIQRCNLVLGMGEDVYMALLTFVAVNWKTHFDGTTMRSIPLLKYIDASGNVSLLSISEARGQSTLSRSQNSQYISWLIDWSMEFNCEGKLFFLPKRTQELCSEASALCIWLRDSVSVKTFSVYDYATQLLKSLGHNRALVLAFAHFLYLSYSKQFINKSGVEELCREMPLLNANGTVSMNRNGVLVPASGSKWVELLGSNPWGSEKYVELDQEYLHSGRYAGQSIPAKVLMNFLEKFAGASDIPHIHPPDAVFPTVYGPMTRNNAFLLLDWIEALTSKWAVIPSKFFTCIKDGSWLKVTMSGCHGYRPPSQSFLPDTSWGSLLQSGSDMVDIPLVDQGFYGYSIHKYAAELKKIGVMTESGQACEFIGKHLMSLARNYNLTKTKVLAMLSFVRFLRAKLLPADEFVDSIKDVEWVKTSCGDKSPGETVLYDQSWQSASAISQIPFIDQGYYGGDIVAYKTELSLLGVKVDFKENYQIVIDNLKSPGSLDCLQSGHLIFALKCIRHSSSSENVVASLKSAKCLRTNTGHYLCPGECFLFDSEWGCLLKVFEGFPYVDSGFYGEEIFEYRNELKRIGVVVEFDAASKVFFTKFKQQASSKGITSENVLSFLACYKKMGEKLRALPDEKMCIKDTNWMRSRLGDFRSPKECILFNTEWDPISRITMLPFVDDTDKCYGQGIHSFKDELKRVGVVVDFDKGAHFVLSNIIFPHDPTIIAPSSVISLLQCIKNSKLSPNSFPKPFLQKIQNTKWLKTTLGYMSPQESLLFDSKQKSSLLLQDGPFIDEAFYGSSIISFKEELAAIGVIVQLSSIEASSLIARHIKSHSVFAQIERIYCFLSDSNWKPGENGAHGMIWIPDSSDDGMWVSPQECVRHDDSDLFRSRLNVLDQKKYKTKSLNFFSAAFGVRTHPTTDDYLTLWKEWEDSKSVILHKECCAFWGHVIKHWNKITEKIISECVTKIPAVSGSSDEYHLQPKQDVFIPDDLLLKDLFEKSPSHDIFVWYPTRKVPGIPRDKLFDIYTKIGVETISESVTMSELSTLKTEELDPVSQHDSHMTKGLFMIILGFLADPCMNMEAKERQEVVEKLRKLSVFETPKPIMMNYSLKMSSADVVKVSAIRMIHWERESSELYTQKLDRSSGYKNIVEYATNFAQVISQGLLWEKEDQIHSLLELIKFGFLMNFDEDAVAYFMKSKKIEIFDEDEEFLSSTFPSC